MFSTLSCNLEGYIFLKFLSNSIWSVLTQKWSIKQNVLLKRRALRKFLFDYLIAIYLHNNIKIDSP